jgi:hypothetical protein
VVNSEKKIFYLYLKVKYIKKCQKKKFILNSAHLIHNQPDSVSCTLSKDRPTILNNLNFSDEYICVETQFFIYEKKNTI